MDVLPGCISSETLRSQTANISLFTHFLAFCPFSPSIGPSEEAGGSGFRSFRFGSQPTDLSTAAWPRAATRRSGSQEG